MSDTVPRFRSIVYINKLDNNMSHFTQETTAEILYSYRERYGGDERREDIFCLNIFKDDNTEAWFPKHRLSLLMRFYE